VKRGEIWGKCQGILRWWAYSRSPKRIKVTKSRYNPDYCAEGTLLKTLYAYCAKRISFYLFLLFDSFWSKVPALGRRGETSICGAKRIFYLLYFIIYTLYQV
jgi:hypothetical protein